MDSGLLLCGDVPPLPLLLVLFEGARGKTETDGMSFREEVPSCALLVSAGEE